ncbi:MAG: Stp1/IreP family PP2C-type Ser/Thr phosphatase [Solirubrobacterales bacterium]|jgi:serine/threonine protein phosphatase PrpC|nr:Stp1/IreP family PP2C-type Ser/Thr phosphatase [Solirubrobacterales bacterium]
MLRVADHFSDSDLGRQREGNEDSLFVRSPLFVVADGMGGARAGEVASQMAVEVFDDPGLPDGAADQGLSQIITEANRRIHETSQSDERHAGMGTTVTAAYVGEQDVTIAHVGDSRAYLLRRGELTRLTSDHSLVGELVARGKLTEEQAETHPQRSVITRALGPEPEVQVDTETYPAREGDVFLLCSDGLTSMVHEPALLEILTSARDLPDAGRQLIAAANRAGGRDNITVVLFELESVERGGGQRAGGESSEQLTRVAEDALTTGEVAAAVRSADDAETPRGAVALAAPPKPAAHRPRGGRPVGPRPARSRRRRVPPAAIVAFLLAIPVISGSLLALRAVYFIGTDPADGRTITVFRGVPYELPGGVRLYTRYGGSGVTLDAVPRARRAVFTDHKLRARDDALGLVDQLELGRLE